VSQKKFPLSLPHVRELFPCWSSIPLNGEDFSPSVNRIFFPVFSFYKLLGQEVTFKANPLFPPSPQFPPPPPPPPPPPSRVPGDASLCSFPFFPPSSPPATFSLLQHVRRFFWYVFFFLIGATLPPFFRSQETTNPPFHSPFSFFDPFVPRRPPPPHWFRLLFFVPPLPN